jgi:hypothetical protein
MFRITIHAGGISPDIGPEAAHDIEKEFHERRQWHKQVTCSFSAGTLTLVALNDFDPDGRAFRTNFRIAFAPISRLTNER